MKNMTCRRLGGPCDQVDRGADHHEVIQAQDRHLEEAVTAGDEAHVPANDEMLARWKRPIPGLKWCRSVQRDFAALPNDD